jgi:hypothetical protein
MITDATCIDVCVQVSCKIDRFDENSTVIHIENND